jgi:hypothetical protein
VLVSYTGAPAGTVNLQVAGVQLIQSTQRADGSIPMIAGRDALLRVFVTASGANTLQAQVRVRLYSGNVALDSFTIDAPGNSVPMTVDTSDLRASWNLIIPGPRVVAGLALQAEVDPTDVVPELNEGDNRWPGGGTTRAITVQNVPALGLRFVPVQQSVNNLTGAVNASNQNTLAEATRRMHPLGTVGVELHTVYTTNAPALQADDANGAWSQILSEIYALRTADGSFSDYVGILPATYPGGVAGLGYIGAPAAVSWDKINSAPGVIAHELGHNFGRYHAPCGNPSAPDPQYPYVNASIGAWGLDLPALALKPPGTYKDVMSYCNPEWISDYNYLGILSFRGTASAQVAGVTTGRDVAPGGSGSEAPTRAGLLVWGRILNGNVILEPSFSVQAPVRLPTRTGPHRVQGFDAQGGRVFSISFAGEEVADLPGRDERHFAFVLPMPAAEQARLASVRLVGNGLTAIQRPPASLRAGLNDQQPRVLRQGDAVEVRWNPAYPLAVIRDARTGQILSLARGGVARITAPGPVRVDLSAGVSSIPGVTLVAP